MLGGNEGERIKFQEEEAFEDLNGGSQAGDGRYPDPELGDLAGFGVGTTIDYFQMEGISEWLQVWK